MIRTSTLGFNARIILVTALHDGYQTGSRSNDTGSSTDK